MSHLDQKSLLSRNMPILVVIIILIAGGIAWTVLNRQPAAAPAPAHPAVTIPVPPDTPPASNTSNSAAANSNHTAPAPAHRAASHPTPARRARH